MQANTGVAADGISAAKVATVAKGTWGSILLLALMLFGGGMMRSVFGPLQEAAKLDLNLSDFKISLVQGLATGLPVALFGLPIAWIIDHGNRVRLLIMLLGICVVGTIWTSFVDGFVTLFAARMLASLGATIALAVVISLTADLCVLQRRGVAMLVLSIGLFAGVAVGFVLGGNLLSSLAKHPLGIFGELAPWREAHLLIGLAGAVMVLPLLFLREPMRFEVELVSTALRDTARALWAKRRFLIPLFAGQLGVTIADTAASIWASPVLIRDYHQQPEQFAGWIGGIILVSGLFGSALGGLSADWGQKTGRRGFILIGAVIATAVGVPAALFPIMPTVTGFAVLFGLLTLSGTVINLVVSTTVAVLVPNEERGTCMAAFGVVNAIFGLGLAPTLVTFGSWAMGGEVHLASSLAIVGVATGVISLLGYSFAMKNAPITVARSLI